MTPAHLTLIQWLSPAFPTGAFAYSHGLERQISTGVVTDAASLEVWLTNVLRYGAGWQDAVLLAQSLDGDSSALDDLARALQPCAERLQETREQGAALARTVAGITGRVLPMRSLPVALGEAAKPLDLPKLDVISLYLQGLAGNLVTIAIRHIPLGQTEGQLVLSRLLPLIHDLARSAADATLDDLGGCALAGDLAALQHETQDVRIFRT
ncbi:urease accessory UreF family protein [Roseovarius sp. BRH_c41]|uniref:urease accessory protein UreF n=1 Tax=Roseovarius sp. BRH_c41 TaxID=1629709 RepID=UPI0005F169CA|nr:urease accessory UreF family protein [Roseovarius sp. BRH_c41]KJS41066.1 MAG: urease accessory protein UreF [Roseovarius sp. BRH_c41]